MRIWATVMVNGREMIYFDAEMGRKISYSWLCDSNFLAVLMKNMLASMATSMVVDLASAISCHATLGD
jgi:hypothetical protein